MMRAKDRAKELSLLSTEARIERAIARQEREEKRTTSMVAFGGVDAATGKAYGTKLDTSTIYFDMETNATPYRGQTLEVAQASQSLFGRGDKRPVK